MPRRAPPSEPPAKPVGGGFPREHAAYSRIYAVVGAIPRGRVASYGQVALLSGLPGRARLVGHALRVLPPRSRVPWQRVVNAAGRVSPRGDPGQEDLQRGMLEAEGVAFGPRGGIDLARFGWRPAFAPARRARRTRS